MTVGENLKQADTTFTDRARQLDAEEEARKKAEKEAKKSPFNNFVQVNLDYTNQIIKLARISPKGAQIFAFLVEHMDGYNALVCSSTVIQEALGMSRASVTRAVKVLKDSKFIDIKKSGTTNVYLINSELVWKSWGTNYKYAEFNAKVIVSESEQEQEKPETKVKTRKKPTAEVVKKGGAANGETVASDD